MSLKRLFATAVSAFVAAVPLSASTQGLEKIMDIYRKGTAPINSPPEDAFSGNVQIGGYFQRSAPSRLSGATVTFEPGARTPWKLNPLGQTLIVTSGTGWAQCGDSAIEEIRAGDTVWCPPGQRHWEGATPDEAMTYVAIHEGSVAFKEKVTDAQYRKGPPAASPQR